MREFLKVVQKHEDLKEELINKLVEAVEKCSLVQDIKFDNQILINAKEHEVSILLKRIKREMADQERVEKTQTTEKSYGKMDTNELLREILKKLDKIIKN